MHQPGIVFCLCSGEVNGRVMPKLSFNDLSYFGTTVVDKCNIIYKALT